jgi:hypothetical protein
VFNKDVKVPLQEAELVGTSSSNNVNNSANNDENEIVFEDAPPVSNGTDDEDSDDEAQTPSYATMSFAHHITWHWNKRKQRIEHEYSIAAWALCVMESVWTDVRNQ